MSLASRIASLKFKYLLQAGSDATLLLIPKRKTILKQFCEDLNQETFGECGSSAYVFDCLWNQRREMSFCDLEVRLYNGDDLAVGSDM